MKTCVILTVCFCVLAYGGFAKTIQVPGDYRFIQEAIDAAQPGDELLLGPRIFSSGPRPITNGRYGSWGDFPNQYTLKIDKSLTIRGSGISRTYIHGDHRSCILISGTADVSFEDLTVMAVVDPVPFIIEGTANATFKDVALEEVALELSGEVNVHIKNAAFKGGAGYISVGEKAVLDLTECEGDNGISINGHAVVRLTECVFKSGMSLTGNGDLFVEQCDLSSLFGSIFISGGQAVFRDTSITVTSPERGEAGVAISGGQAVFTDTTISGASWGIQARGGHIEMERTTVSSSPERGTSVSLSKSSVVVVNLCHIGPSRTGIQIRDEAEVQISRTVVSNCSYAGIQLFSGEAIIEECEIHENGEAGISLEGTARAIITDSSIKDNDGWGIAAQDDGIAVGWGNTVTGNQRDLFGVSDWLIKRRRPTKQAVIVVPREAHTIEEAVYRVAEGGTVVVEAGDYSEERVAIYKRINLEGQGHEVVLGGIALFNKLGDIYVSNLKIIGATNGIGIFIPKGNHLQLDNVIISNWNTGLRFLSGSSATVSGSTISENATGVKGSLSALALQRCDLLLNSQYAISTYSEDVKIQECSIFDNGEGISVSGTTALIKDSTIERNGSGVDACGYTCNIEDCLISANKGIGVSSYGVLTIRGSRILDNTGGGIYVSQGELTIISSEVASNKFGVFLDYRGEDVKKLVGRDICIQGNSSRDLVPPVEEYPWPREFEECVQLDQVLEPPLIEDFYADVTDEGEATLGWTNPADLELSQVVICRGTDGWPTGHTDGFLVYEDLIPEAGSKAEYIDTDLVAGQTYYYAVFSSDSGENWNDRVEQGKNAAIIAITAVVEDTFPSCIMQLRGKVSRSVVTEVDVGVTFEIYVGGSDDDRGIEGVRFSSDEVQDGNPTGEWTDWYSWSTSSQDWDSTLKVKERSFVTGGQKEVWAQIRDSAGNVSGGRADISVHPGYAIVVSGEGGWREKRGLDHCANNAYRALRNLGFDDDHIFYLNSNSPQDVDGDGDDEVDAGSLLDSFAETLREVENKIGSNATPLILYFSGHGATDCFIFNGLDSEQGYLWVSNPTATLGLHELLGEFQAKTPVLAIVGSCYSGCFIISSVESPGSISATNRIIITANHDDNDRILWGWVRSSDCFWGDLIAGSSVKEAFSNRTLPVDQRHLWLDDNGDMIGHAPHSLEDDGVLAVNTTIGVPGSDNLKLKPWVFYWLRSPGELRMYDAQGQVTGLVDGEIREEIPDSLYDGENKIVALFSPTDSYYCQVVGTDEGRYELDATSIENGTATAFTATDIPTIPGAVHRYTIDWNALARGEEGVVLQMDIDGEGTFEKTSQVGSELDGRILATPEITPPQDGAANTWLWIIFGVCGASVLIIAVVVSVKWTNWRKSSKGL